MRDASSTPSRKPGAIGPAASTAAHPFSTEAAESAVWPSLRARSASSKYFDPALLTRVAAAVATDSASATRITPGNSFNIHLLSFHYGAAIRASVDGVCA